MNNSLFTIDRISAEIDGKSLYKATIDVGNRIFDGHFPSTPVVPGVCTISMIKRCVADIISCDKIHFIAIKECKFLGAIVPAQHSSVDVSITLKRDAEFTEVTALVFSGETTMVKLRATAQC